MSGEFVHPLWPESSERTARGLLRRVERLERRKHGPWRNAGDPDQPSLAAGITPVVSYINGVGVRWRRQLGGGFEVEIAVDGGADGDPVIAFPASWFLTGEGRRPKTGHSSLGPRAFYLDTSTGLLICGV